MAEVTSWRIDHNEDVPEASLEEEVPQAASHMVIVVDHR